ncbi:MAG: hypothetical protein LUD77_08260 [Clostridiales bacterium]|nr:hypothetical protein [Clostridiales bacterium]
MGRKMKVSLETAKKVIISEILSDLYTEHKGEHYYNTVYLEGTMGIGKSAIFRSIVDFMSEYTGEKWGFLDMRLATMSASDIQGIPHPEQQPDGTWVMKWMKDAVLPGVNKALPKYGIILMDELNQVKEPAVKSIMYQFILDRKINDYVMPDTWYQGCAGNREEDGGIYDRLLAPVRDRMLILEIKPDAKETLQYFKDNDFHPAVIEYLEGFITHTSGEKEGIDDVLHSYNAELEMSGDEECKNYIFTTPRTYEFVSNVLKAHEKLAELASQNKDKAAEYVSEDNVLKARLCGLMGAERGADFFRKYKRRQCISLADIKEAKWLNGKPDRKLPPQETFMNNQDVQVYISSLMGSRGTDDDIKKAIIKWLIYIKVRPQTLIVMYNQMSEVARRELTVELHTSNCTEMINTLTSYMQNKKFRV